MQHRVNLFIMFATCVGLCAQSGTAYEGRFEALFAGMPGGEEAMPHYTRFVVGLLIWLARWWLLLVALGAAVLFGGPSLLRRSPGGREHLASADAWMTKYHGTVVVVFVAMMFSIYWAIDLALTLPWLRVMEQLSGG